MRGQSATLVALPLTYCLSSSVLAIESRTPARPAAVVTAPAVATLHLHLLTWCCSAFLSCRRDGLISISLPTSTFNEVILTPKLINPKANSVEELLEFKLQGQNYIRCKALMKLKHMKQRTLLI